MNPINDKLAFNKFNKIPTFPILKPKQRQIFVDNSKWRKYLFLSIIVLVFTLIFASFYAFFDNYQRNNNITSLFKNSPYSNQIINENQAYKNKLISNFGFIHEDNLVTYKQNLVYQKEVIFPFIQLVQKNNKLALGYIDNDITKDVTRYNQRFLPNLKKNLLVSTSNYNTYNPNTEDQILDWNLFIKEGSIKQIANNILEIVKVQGYDGITLEANDNLFATQSAKYSELIKTLKLNLKSEGLDFQLAFNNSFNSELVRDLGPEVELIFGTKQNLIVEDYKQNLDLVNGLKKNEIKNKIILFAPTTNVNRSIIDKKNSYEAVIDYNSVGELIKKYQTNIKLSDNGYGFEFNYKDNNIDHNVLVNDATTYFNLTSLSKEAGVEIGLNNLVASDPSIYKIINKNDNIDSQLDILKNQLEFNSLPLMKGEGEILNLLDSLKYGKREVEFKDGRIVNQKIIEHPQPSLVHKSGRLDSKVVLTFDDGPDPVYTPKVLDILKQNNIKATFFVVGDKVSKHPEILRRIYAEGHEVGNHTFNHVYSRNLDNLSFENEVIATQEIIKQTIGIKPVFFRTPFNDLDGPYTKFDQEKLDILHNNNLQISESDIDTRDWEINNKSIIIANVTDKIKSGQSGQIVMHDGGGKNREITVSALPEIINFVKSSNYQFITMDELVKADILSFKNYNVSQELNKYEESNLNKSQNWIEQIINVFVWYLKICSVIALVRLLFMLIIYFHELSKRSKANKQVGNLLNTNMLQMPSVDVIVPCFNEEKVVCQTVASILGSKYQNFNIIVIDDCSSDKSFELLLATYRNNPQVKLLHKRNGGKAQALNYAIKNSTADYVICCDADTLFLPSTIFNLMKHFNDKDIAGVAGFVQVGNDSNFLARLQKQEYIYGQNFDKISYSGLDAVIVVPGAIGAWKKKILLEVGLYDTDTLAEDTDLTIKVLKKGYKVVYDHEAISITEVPETLRDLFKQRVRWQFGSLQLLYKNRRMIFNPKHKFVGMFLIPEILSSFIFMGILPITDVLILSGIFKILTSLFLPESNLNNLMNYNDLMTAIFFSLIYFCIYFFSYLWATYLDKSSRKWSLIWILPFHIFVYRHFLWYVNLVVMMRAIRGLEVGWNKLARTGNAIKKPIKV